MRLLLLIFGSSRLSKFVKHSSLNAIFVSVPLSAYVYVVSSFRYTVTVELYFQTPVPVRYVAVTETPWLGAMVPVALHTTEVEEVVPVVLADSFETAPRNNISPGWTKGWKLRLTYR